jgi:enamine deaminase RidA (YjgF/YER057c/UK114 family)
MGIKRIEVGSRMSEAVIHNGTVYLSGSAADSLDADITVQTRETLDYIDQMLAKCGTDKSHLLSALVWIKSFDDFAGMNAVYDKWIDPKNPPVRACVHSAELYDSRVLVEIKVIAAMPERAGTGSRARVRKIARVTTARPAKRPPAKRPPKKKARRR